MKEFKILIESDLLATSPDDIVVIAIKLNGRYAKDLLYIDMKELEDLDD